MTRYRRKTATQKVVGKTLSVALWTVFTLSLAGCWLFLYDCSSSCQGGM